MITTKAVYLAKAKKIVYLIWHRLSEKDYLCIRLAALGQ